MWLVKGLFFDVESSFQTDDVWAQSTFPFVLVSLCSSVALRRYSVLKLDISLHSAGLEMGEEKNKVTVRSVD